MNRQFDLIAEQFAHLTPRVTGLETKVEAALFLVINEPPPKSVAKAEKLLREAGY